MRTDRWKYVRYIGRDPRYEELYDLVNDPGEERNLAADAEYTSTLEKMRQRWSVLRSQLEPVPEA